MSAPLPILIRSGFLFKINTSVLPPECNKPEIINNLYKYVQEKYAWTKGKHTINEVNEDLTNLLKREGLLE